MIQEIFITVFPGNTIAYTGPSFIAAYDALMKIRGTEEGLIGYGWVICVDPWQSPPQNQYRIEHASILEGKC